ncbi:hypothetical protein MJN85_29240, partial [Salmonella enterica subsp. enterica serovar Anatum]|nr:hypothetical protein [Salmonella enterica subsp. enterica serovar Anatum]
TGLLPLVTDNLPMRLLPTEIMSGAPVRSRDISLGDDPGINGHAGEFITHNVSGKQHNKAAAVIRQRNAHQRQAERFCALLVKSP